MKLLLVLMLNLTILGSVRGSDAAEPAAILKRLGAGDDRAAMRAAMMDLFEAAERVGPEAMFEAIIDWAAPRGPAGIAGPMLASRVGLRPDVVLKGLARRLGDDDPQARRFAASWLSILAERQLDHQRMEWVELMLPDKGDPPPAVAVAAFDASPLDAFELFARRYGGDASALRSLRLEVHEGCIWRDWPSPTGTWPRPRSSSERTRCWTSWPPMSAGGFGAWRTRW